MSGIEALQQRWERREQRAKRSRKATLLGMAVTFTAGIAVGCAITATPTAGTPIVAAEAPAITTTAPTPVPMPTPTFTMTARSATVTVNDDPEAPRITAAQEEQIAALLRSVPFDGNTQNAIYELCNGDDDLFCSVMAIGENESQFTATAVGDGGRCVGWMQINYAYHTERMERLGVTDLTDPVQCAAVAIDYLKELSANFGDTDTHALYMAYNRGPTGARAAMNAGVFSDAYTWNVMASRDSFMAELASNTQ